MFIRPAQTEDFNQLLGLLRQLNPADPEVTQVEHQVFAEINAAKNFELIVAEIDSILVSCYLNIIPNMTAGGRPYAVIENVITDSANRNQGNGKALVTHALELAWKKIATKLCSCPVEKMREYMHFKKNAVSTPKKNRLIFFVHPNQTRNLTTIPLVDF
jgi:N-acetylglutamate synthase-like GNAT family acetyltransferase